MPFATPDTDDPLLKLQREVLGYLNFSSGASDPKFLQSLSQLFELIQTSQEKSTKEGEEEKAPLVADRLLQGLAEQLEKLRASGGAFADAEQASAVIRLTCEFRATYSDFHEDLLWGCEPERLWRPYFLGRVFESLLAFGGPWDASDIVEHVRDRFDDYLGYRPIAVLETEQKIEPYRHEWVRPIPLAIESAGAACGPYRELIEMTLSILGATAPDLLRAAWFDPDLLEELAVDPRPYDFDHPVHKRPNHHFGQWDPNRIDAKGFFRRFVLQPVVLESLMERVESASVEEETAPFARKELLYEAAAVLAGTILMASGVSGAGPNAHSSEENLSTLLPQIAEYRDCFYEELVERANGPHAERLRGEATRMRQPFAGARQHLNHEISRRRARQLQKVQLARLYARMGRPEAALEQASEVRVASARMQCEVYCRLTAGHQAIDAGDLTAVTTTLTEIEALLDRGIECGALVDPWNVVGFGGNFSLFPSLENTVRDYRVDDLIQLVEQLLGLGSRAWTEAAAIDDESLEEAFSKTLERVSVWWDQFATPMVSGVRRLVAKEVEVSTNLVAGALNAWHKAGAASGDIGFWGMFVVQFDSPKAFQLVIEALLEKRDHVASMALLMRWLCQVDITPLEDGEASFHTLAERWLLAVEALERETDEDRWPLVEKFFDHLEANAEQLWDAPRFELGRNFDPDDPLDDLLGDDLTEGELFDEEDAFEQPDPLEEIEDEEDELGLYDAAYDGVTFEDSTDDGMESSIYEPTSDETRLELEEEAERLEARLAFLKTLARLWKHAAIAWGTHGTPHDDRRTTLEVWHRAALERSAQLGTLLESVYKHRLSQPHTDQESMIEYDRLRSVKDTILEGVIGTCVDVADARRVMRAAVGAIALEEATQEGAERPTPPKASGAAVGVLRAVLRSDRSGVTEHWPQLVRSLLAEELLYVPIAGGGDPRKIVRVRALHCLIGDLLNWLPRLGMVSETCELLAVAQQMELEHPVGRGAVTEYDRLFESGYQAIVRCLVDSSASWETDAVADPLVADLPIERRSDGLLVQSLQDLTEQQLQRWLQHSRTVRLSIVERLVPSRDWDRFVRFVERYGGDLFTQRFLILSNLRAILHQGVGIWLDNLKQDEGDDSFRIVQELDAGLSRDDAVRDLTLAIESVAENYREYREYNATTTQSDRGDLLYTLINFLRLRNGYDRVAWNLKPVYLAHRILVRRDRPIAAELWRRAVAERTDEAASAQVQSLHQMNEQYGMSLPAIGERISERFVRPLVIDRVCSLVRPAMDRTNSGSDAAFSVLREEIGALLEGPTGAGLEASDWLAGLEQEVASERHTRRHQLDPEQTLNRIPQAKLTWPEAQEQLQPETPEQEAPGKKRKKRSR